MTTFVSQDRFLCRLRTVKSPDQAPVYAPNPHVSAVFSTCEPGVKEWMSDLMMVLKWLLIKIVCVLNQGVSVKSVPKVPEVPTRFFGMSISLISNHYAAYIIIYIILLYMLYY